MDLKESAVRFIHTRCEGLGYDPAADAREKAEGIFLGTGLKKGQVPYAMQMDTDRRCLEVAVSRFLDSGTAKDAFDVYFCYMEIFIGKYGKTRRMIEQLSEFENNGSSLLMKHRDHYSHSVYVFTLGLAIFETNTEYRKIYAGHYGLEEGPDAASTAHHFLKYWGLASLFHDIGYPFEIPFEQVASYFEVDNEKREERPYLAYHGLSSYTGKSAEVFAENLAEKLGSTYNFDRDYILKKINDKPRHPEEFNHFMDHAFFSASVLYKRLYEDEGIQPAKPDVDALCAILIHNSMYKFVIAHYKDPGNIPFKAELMPLAYMLMLCDELQCWDRTAYGRNSRLELHPMDCRFEFGDGIINAAYIYDESQRFKEAGLKKKAPGKPAFDADIASIVALGLVGLTSSILWEENERSKKRTYLSDSSFLSLYNFAVALNGRWLLKDEWEQAKAAGTSREYLDANMESFTESFENLSLEYKLSNINQAKSFDYYLNEIGAFYTDRPVDFPLMEEFSEKECRLIGPLEHGRWLKEHLEMGWKHGNLSGDERELKRMHRDMIDDSLLVKGELTQEGCSLHYRMLNKEEQDKDVKPMNAMLDLLNIFDGVRVYRLK